MAKAGKTSQGGVFRSIGYYTKFVDIFKLALALLALMLVAMLIVIPILNNGDGGARLVFSSIEKSVVSEKPKMIKPRYQGMDAKGQPFTVTADSAIQVDADRVQLERLTADILMKDGKWAALTANEGLLDLKGHQVDVKGNVDVFYDEGYEFTTEAMHVDMEKKIITSILPVKGHGPAGTLDAAGGFEARQADGRILFKGPVHMLIYTGDEQ